MPKHKLGGVLNKTIPYQDWFAAVLDGELLTNFSELLTSSFAGGFNIATHTVATHPNYPQVTDYGSQLYSSYFTGGHGGLAINPTTGNSMYLLGHHGAYDTTDISGPNGGGIDSITEVQIPTLVKNADPKDITGFNQTTQLQPWRGIFDANNGFSNVEGQSAVTGVHVDGNTLLLQTMAEFDTAPYQNTNLIVLDDRTDLENTTFTGFFAAQPANKTDWVAHAATWISDIPTEHQATFNNATKVYGSGAVFSIIDRLPTGPTLFTGGVPSTDPSIDNSVPLSMHMDFENVDGKFMCPPEYKGINQYYGWEYFNADRTANPDYRASAEDSPDGKADYTQIQSWINDWWNVLSFGAHGFIIPNTRTYCVIGIMHGKNGGLGYKSNPPWRGSASSGPTRLEENDIHPYYWLFDLDTITTAANPWDIMPYEYGPIDCLSGLTNKDGDMAIMANATFDLSSGTIVITYKHMWGGSLPASSAFVFQNNSWSQ